MNRLPLPCLSIASALLLAGCAGGALRDTPSDMFTHARSSEHRGDDDLLSGGLGLEGLRAPTPPAFADPGAPTPAELRRRALWTNWRGIADLAPGGGYGELYGSLEQVPGREFHAYATLPGARQPHRVMVQLPDAFDADAPCVLVTASSGSRGIYGAIAVAGAWGLPKGCAVAYTDKGNGTDYFDLDAQQGVRIDGTVGALDEVGDLAFAPDAPVGTSGVAFKHAHSQDNPEADWGRHVQQAAQYALQVLGEAYPQRRFDFANTRVVAVGISNGGGAVLRAAELAGSGANAGWLDAVVAGEPNITVAGATPLYDTTTRAALLMPCALPALGIPAMPYAEARCAALAEAGLVEGDDLATRQRSALDALRADGWSDEALRAGSISVAFDLWRAVAATYASTYGRYGVGEHPCGFAFSAQAGDGSARAATTAERAAWWADGSGIPPGAGVGLVDPHLDGSGDPTLAGLRCLRALWEGEGADAARVRAGVAEITASPPRPGLPVVVVHGTDDGLVPMAFTSQPYVAAARAAGRDVRYWQVRNAQHFDAFLGLPAYAAQYVPLLPYVYEALDRVWAHLDGTGPLPADAMVETVPRGQGKSLSAANLAMP